MPALSTLYVDIKANPKPLERGLKAAKKKLKKSVATMKTIMNTLTFSHPLLAGTAVVGGGAFGISKIGTAALDTAASFEQMGIKLDQLTDGRGQENLDRLNKWALDMPINTKKAVDTFIMLKAMGVDPTIESMAILADVSAIFGEESMEGIARAIGQITTNGRILGEELNQLSERGINARGILIDAFGMSIQDLQKANIDIKRITGALWDGLEEQFGGAAAASMNSWAGLVATFESYVMEMQRIIMDAGVFEMLKGHLGDINNAMKEWIYTNQEFLTQDLPEYLKQVGESASTAAKTLYTVGKWTVGVGKSIYETPINAMGMSLKDFHSQALKVGGYIADTVDMLKLHKELRDEIREEGKMLTRYSVEDTLQYSPLEIDPPDMEAHLTELKRVSDNAQITFDKMYNGLASQNQRFAESQKSASQKFEETISGMQKTADKLRLISEPAYREMVSRMDSLRDVFYKNLNDEQARASAENAFKLEYSQFLDELAAIGEEKDPYESLRGSIANLTEKDYSRVVALNEQIKTYMVESRELLKYAEGEAYQENIEQLDALQKRLTDSDAWDKMLEKQRDVSKEMQKLADGTASIMQSTFEDVLFDALEGKFKSLEEIVEDLLKNIAKMMIRFMAQQAVMKVFSLITGGGGTPVLGGGQTNTALAGGGVITEPIVGMGLKTGNTYEMGEGGNPEAIMPVNRITKGMKTDYGKDGVVINIVNNSGQPIENETTQRLDGERVIINTVISAIKTNKGGLRSYMGRR